MTDKFWSKQAIQELVNEHNFQSGEQIQAIMKERFKDVLEATLKAELDTQLDYALYDHNKETKNSRNGYGKKRFIPNTAIFRSRCRATAWVSLSLS